jgi:hypothetical protein
MNVKINNKLQDIMSKYPNYAFFATYKKPSKIHYTSYNNFTSLFFNNTADYILAIQDHSLTFRVTIPDAATIKFDLLKMSMVLLETCRGL